MRYSYQSSENTPIWVLIGINLVFFILILVTGTFSTYPPNSLYYNLVLSLNNLSQHPWTIITCLFAHNGFWHIFANMLTLFFFGTFLIRLIGGKRFLTVYFVGGLAGNLLFLLFAYLGISVSANTGVVGASGAIFTVCGVLVILTPNLRVFFFGLIPLPLWVAIGIGCLIILPGVAWQAHIGGLIAGLLFGLYYRQQARRYRIR